MITSSENYPDWVEDLQFETNARGGWVVPAYTSIPCDTVIPPWSQLGAGCKIGARCTLGEACKIGDYCEIGARCTLGEGCNIGAGCKIGHGCTLGACCTLGNDCNIGAGCKIGHGCTLGACCTLGAEAQWMGVTVQSWLALSNVDGTGRQVKVVKHAEGVRVEAGCFQGSLEEFCAKAASEGKGRYARVVAAVAAAM